MRFEDRMSDADALMWTIEKDPMLRSTIAAVVVLDRPPDREALTYRLERASRRVPRLRQRVVGNPFSLAPPRWEVDPHFDLSYHVRWLRLPEGSDLDHALPVVEPIAMQGFDRARPLWEFYVLDGLADGGAAIVMKLHHAITDGIGAVKIGMELFDLEARPEVPEMPDAPPVRVLNMRERTLDAMDHERRRQLGIARRVPATLGAAVRRLADDPAAAARQVTETIASAGRLLAPAPHPLSPVMRRRSLSVHFDTLSLSLEETKRAAKAAGGRLNDAFVAGVIGGMSRYHEHLGAPVDALRMTMPINVRNDATEDLAGNAFAPARFLVPLDIADPIARMRRVRELVSQARAEPSLTLLEPMAMFVYRLPTSASTAMFQTMLKGVDFITSNVPGIPVPLYLAGAAVRSQFAFGPMSGAAANLTLVSYQDQIHVGINTDPAAVTDREAFLSCLRDGFAEVLKVA